jgi:predicted O-linked N-acetylglucosamine transferase (SPINDLY family)
VAREHGFMRGRLASSIVRRMELHELAANTDDAFIDMAVTLAINTSRRQELCAEIASRRKILFNDMEPVRALERCLTEAIGQR